MKARKESTFIAARSEGGLIPSDYLEKIFRESSDVKGITNEDYHLEKSEKIREQVNRAWNRLTGCWSAFRKAASEVPADDPGTTVTREKWLLPLFQELGYGRLNRENARVIEAREYAVSHMWARVPIHLVGVNIKLDTRTKGVAGAATNPPHSLVQEFLNHSDDHL
jgi:hypothetical protein